MYKTLYIIYILKKGDAEWYVKYHAPCLSMNVGFLWHSHANAGVLVPLKTDKSEHSSLTGSLIFDKTCIVPHDTILFIERMNRI
jgi:hypothetical protein